MIALRKVTWFFVPIIHRAAASHKVPPRPPSRPENFLSRERERGKKNAAAAGCCCVGAERYGDRMTRRPCVRSDRTDMSGRSSQAEIRVAFIELFDLGGRFDKRQGRRDAEEEEGAPRDQVGLIDGRSTKRKDAACRKRQQIVNNFLERPRGWKALSYHLTL
ncbi:uncharacterized protein TNCT_377901 [Trichonephila clavata]|uniref:Uncharacterized protein n=1 Tax=Trichonephila clavata TaxID=2740835 RepID=A0A8X6L7Z4_TRICU|nr:uncharacterized protein TNCT_377901 [Trichonephila clavata]